MAFKSNCPHCQTQLDLEREWIGMEVECPECQNSFTVPEPPAPQRRLSRPPQQRMPQQQYPGYPPQNPYGQYQMPQQNPYGNPGMGYQVPQQNPCGMGYQPGTSTPGEKSTASLVLGLIGLIAWIIPLIGFPVTIVGLILGIKKKYTPGIVLNVICLLLTVANSAIGAFMGYHGML